MYLEIKIQLLFSAGGFILPGVSEIHQHLRSVQQGVDQGEDLYPAEKTGQQGNIDPVLHQHVSDHLTKKSIVYYSWPSEGVLLFTNHILVFFVAFSNEE